MEYHYNGKILGYTIILDIALNEKRILSTNILGFNFSISKINH